ncbi:hypothetical protein HMPREF0072_0717 [Anaerococcus lactolyticus ATCC 51172]|uniref:Uncharacterized protein n=1 Tax=Anaerococcus lactolyticus ATCC 51172 TaxID=525254 RepID=C2BEE7_9FIRM|nr:hypothetical protein HMPREF0072_0717 [Anaerococcus lactolyticus ATCC 51172]
MKACRLCKIFIFYLSLTSDSLNYIYFNIYFQKVKDSLKLGI